MTKKVKVAVFDQDLKIRQLGDFPLTSDGSKINIKSGGKGHFNPSFSNTSYLEFPYRSIFSLFRIRYKRVYVVRNSASKCVNFHTEEVPAPDPEEVMKAASAKILENMGRETQETPFILYIILGVLVGIALKVFEVIV